MQTARPGARGSIPNLMGCGAMAHLLLCTLVLGQSYEEKQRIVDAATAKLRKALEVAPNDAGKYRELGRMYANPHGFMRAASGALAVAASLVPMDADVWTELGAMRQNARDGEGAREAFEQVIALRPNSGRAHFDLSGVSPTPELHLRRALELDPQLSLAYSSLARVLSRASRHAEAEDALRGLVHVDPTAGAKRLYDHLFFGMRKAEAAVSYKMAIHARNRSILETDSLAVEWKEYVDDLVAKAPTAQPKCLERRCIQGLEDALKQAAGGPQAVTVHPPHTAASVDHMIRNPVPTVLRRAAEGWAPTIKWDAEHLLERAGDEPLEITVVTVEGEFEVRPDRIERPAKSTMRIGDFVRMLSLRTDANLTLYSRQAPLWPMSGLLRDLRPLEWMEKLRLTDLNFWLGDGHFRNTLHNDPYDNFLCQIRGSKHLLLYPPDATDLLYYGPRRDIQANYSPLRGEYGRRDTGIVSHNTAEINGAAPDLAAFPKFREALKVQSYASVQPSDCLYLPIGWHHHVFSEADAGGGYNLALNIWIERAETVSGIDPYPIIGKEPYPTLGQLMQALDEVDVKLGVQESSVGSSQALPADLPEGVGSCVSDDG